MDKAWGENRYTWGDTPTTRRFTGQIEHSTIGLYFYNARYYPAASRGTSSASLGRFVQADTIVPNPSNPQDLNRYSYAANNALRYTDPTGHWYYDPGCQCLVKTKDPSHENAIDPVSLGYVGPGRYLNYDETPDSNPTGWGFRPGVGGASFFRFEIPTETIAQLIDHLSRVQRRTKRTGIPLPVSLGMEHLSESVDKVGWRADFSWTHIIGVDFNLELACGFSTYDCTLNFTKAVQGMVGATGPGFTTGPIVGLSREGEEARAVTGGADFPIFGVQGEIDLTVSPTEQVLYVGAGLGSETGGYLAVGETQPIWSAGPIDWFFRFLFE